MILAGGKGERFWPLSTRRQPKPFLDLRGRGSLLEETLRRAARVASPGRVRVVAPQRLAAAVRREISAWKGVGALVEPAALNTGPACLYAARWVAERDSGATLLVLPSDHFVAGMAEFRRSVQRARRLAEKGSLVTFGIRPEVASTEYGYILRGAPLGSLGHRVRRFVEKPSLPKARRLIGMGSLWNSGMFVWNVGTFLEEAARCEAAFARWLRAADGGGTESPSARRAFRKLPALPVDRAVLERSDRVAVVKASFRWSDLGSWEALFSLLAKDAGGNGGVGKWTALRSRRNLVYSSEGLCVLEGVDDFLVVRVKDKILVAPRRDALGLKRTLQDLRKRGFGAYL
jgi:mannose-1-phosphate guanylyltransferase/mannose-6-phosphate isomerase